MSCGGYFYLQLMAYCYCSCMALDKWKPQPKECNECKICFIQNMPQQIFCSAKCRNTSRKKRMKNGKIPMLQKKDIMITMDTAKELIELIEFVQIDNEVLKEEFKLVYEFKQFMDAI